MKTTVMKETFLQLHHLQLLHHLSMMWCDVMIQEEEGFAPCPAYLRDAIPAHHHHHHNNNNSDDTSENMKETSSSCVILVPPLYVHEFRWPLSQSQVRRNFFGYLPQNLTCIQPSFVPSNSCCKWRTRRKYCCTWSRFHFELQLHVQETIEFHVTDVFPNPSSSITSKDSFCLFVCLCFKSRHGCKMLWILHCYIQSKQTHGLKFRAPQSCSILEDPCIHLVLASILSIWNR